jgi:hypothetical protein
MLVQTCFHSHYILTVTFNKLLVTDGFIITVGKCKSKVHSRTKRERERERERECVCRGIAVLFP